MLQQILKDMYIDPDVLEALNEEQKKTLFLKMREEQVRRWKEREEKLEREGEDAESKRAKPRKANDKSVSWQLGRDGDVAVIVIGEVDELSSKFICSGFGEKKTPSLQNTCLQTILKSRKNTEPVRTERQNLPTRTQPGISLNLKQGKCEERSTLLPLPVSVSEHSTLPATEKPELKSANATEEKSLPQLSICSRPPMRASPVNTRLASGNAAPGYVNTRPGPTNLRLATAVPSSSPSSAVKIDSGTTSPTKGSLHSKEPQNPQGSLGGKDIGEKLQKAASEEPRKSGSAPICAGRGRVAQLTKTFSTDQTANPMQTTSRGFKPPLPTKPSHLRQTSTPTVR